MLDAELYMFKEGFRELSTCNGAYKWRLSNLLALKEIMETQTLQSNIFEIGGCKFQIGKMVLLIGVAVGFFV